jgi:hypothetical protein
MNLDLHSVFPDSLRPWPLQLARLVVLCLVFAMGGWSLVNAFREKRFNYRGGRPTPLWLGRVMSVLLGFFLIWPVIAFWNR